MGKDSDIAHEVLRTIRRWGGWGYQAFSTSRLGIG